MSAHNDLLAIRQMRDYALEAVSYLDGKTRAQLGENRILQNATIRVVEVVGEAANRVSKAAQAGYPGLPWRQVISLRNRLIHGYDEVIWMYCGTL